MIKRRNKIVPIRRFDVGGSMEDAFLKSGKKGRVKSSDWIFGSTNKMEDVNNNQFNTNYVENNQPITRNELSLYNDINNKLNYTVDVKPGSNLSFDDMFNSVKNFQNNVNSALSFKERIGNVESKSSGGYNAYNSSTGATGKYQFLPKYFRESVKRLFNISWSEFARCPECQERLMDYHINTNLVPSANKLERQFPNSGLSKDQLMALVHFKGEGGARKELSNPHLLNQSTKINMSSLEYLNRFK